MLTINAEIRKERGKGNSNRLRKDNKLPAIVYGGDKEPIAIELSHDVVINQESKPEFYEIFTLVVEGEKHKVKVQDVQRHPFKPKLIHIDLLLVQ
ncbi:50S ribosomal protein L25 [Arsenophonus endosymbiont of Aleurodicus dispersus]|uniref:50S ribosomal protein L25 n=1 Tax=Arsenophonus endosymbiont of Aleurodicus dispersus TaxID=235559 RepID=UPI000EB49844|nr:50S ribosomal protein L25 [Arsenophonus endosymbiont of Aleurodicus dispersus]VAY02222.1 50S ribosomal protein L25 [Arsenophonus endosymbiont of Aleurodicus dispersus]